MATLAEMIKGWIAKSNYNYDTNPGIDFATPTNYIYSPIDGIILDVEDDYIWMVDQYGNYSRYSGIDTTKQDIGAWQRIFAGDLLGTSSNRTVRVETRTEYNNPKSVIDPGIYFETYGGAEIPLPPAQTIQDIVDSIKKAAGIAAAGEVDTSLDNITNYSPTKTGIKWFDNLTSNGVTIMIRVALFAVAAILILLVIKSFLGGKQ